MARALKTCSVAGCPELTRAGRCAQHQQAADRARGTRHQRGYTGPGHNAFRTAVLARDPRCVLCGAPSQHADHHPYSRRELVARGLNPNDPAHGRGLCAPCHSRETAQHQPGGWNQRN